jgi:hypothetical protein
VADGTSCTATSPAVSGAGVVDIRVTNVSGQTSQVVAADQYTYTAAPVNPNAPVITGIAPQTGVTVGGTKVTITGTGLTNNPDGTPAHGQLRHQSRDRRLVWCGRHDLHRDQSRRHQRRDR